MTNEDLKLENQLCFPLYAVSRLITKSYKPFLEELGITYPQYLVLLVLWEEDKQSVNEIAERLYLNTNTVTPLLKRMEANGFLKRNRSSVDERKVIVHLTKNGKDLKNDVVDIPIKIASNLCSEATNFEELQQMREYLKNILKTLT